MQMEVIDCQAPTVEKMQIIPVDTQAPTVQKEDMVNPVQSTKAKPSTLIFRYKINDPNSKIIPFLPKKPIEKSNDEYVTFGRTLNFDVFLNDECMSRDYIHLYAERNNPSQFKVVNFSKSKPAIVDNNQLGHNDWCYINDKSVLQLDTITFFVSIQSGDKNAGKYVVWIQPVEIESHQNLCRQPHFHLQTCGNCQLTFFHTSLSHQPNSSQIYNSSNSKSISPHLNQNKPKYWYHDGNISTQRQPQEHEMASEDDLHLEKQKQYQFIEHLAKK